ncbi:MAG: threonine/serine exporter family protein [Symbiobacteriaceae bacterium]|nr:threonine/serine exporter family protein [Symbiobacteriaceae bacterium]
MIDLQLLINFGGAALGAWCYGYLFGAPLKILIPGALAGGVAFACVYLCGEAIFWGTALGALGLGFIARLVAPRLRVPLTAVIVPGIIPIVPGVSAYNAFMAAVQGDYILGITGMINVVTYTMAIAMGLNGADLLYRVIPRWQRGRKQRT